MIFPDTSLLQDLRALATEILKSCELVPGSQWSKGWAEASVSAARGIDALLDKHQAEGATNELIELRTLCIGLYSAIKAMPLPPHVPESAGEQMRQAMGDFEEWRERYTQDYLKATGRDSAAGGGAPASVTGDKHE